MSKNKILRSKSVDKSSFKKQVKRKNIEKKVQIQKPKFTEILNLIQDGVFITGLDNKIDYINPILKKQLGPVKGQKCYEYFYGLSKPCSDCIKKKVISGKTIRREYYFPRTKKTYDVLETPIKNHNGKILKLKIMRDITKRKKIEVELEKSEKQMKKSQEIAHLGSWELDVVNNRLSWSDEVYRIFGLQPKEFGATYEAFLESVHPEDRAAVDAVYSGSLLRGEDNCEIEHQLVRKNGEIRIVHEKCEYIRDKSGKIIQLIGILQDITEQKRIETELQRIEWLLKKSVKSKNQYTKRKIIQTQPYGDLTLLNRSPLIRDSVGKDLLADIMSDYLDLLDTSAAVYEKNGDYAIGIFTSGWCKFMDQASHSLCGTDDNRKALNSGKWLCHESCWMKASKKTIKTGQPADIKCEGGIHIYAVPIKAGKEIIGSINFGYGDPPRSTNKLKKLAEKYNVNFEELCRYAEAYQSRPPYIIELAKFRLETSARLIGEIIVRKLVEKKLQESEEKYRHIVENTTNLIMVTKPDGIISYLSPSSKDVIGYPPKELVGTNPIIYHPDDAEKVQLNFSRALRGKKGCNFQYRVITKNGETKWISHSWSPVFTNKELQSVVSIIEDITKRKEIENNIQELNENLLYQTNELLSMNKELEAFSYSVSHDLRAPLRSIDGFSLAMLEDYYDRLDDQGKDYLKRIRNATQRMEQLIEDMLRLSRLTRTEMIIQQVDLGQATDEIIKGLEKKEPTRKVKFIKHDQLIANGDFNLTYILLENLLENAWKFTKIRKQAEIEFGKKQQNQQTVFYIRDNGVGFNMKYYNRLFIPFQRLHANTDYPGTGIGLSIASRIVHRHGGRIWVEAEENKGTTFYFTLGGKTNE
jgi:PAS domain S-box-containing protein